MPKVEALDSVHGAALVVPPDGGENHWQPVPANGHISVRVAPHLVDQDYPFSLGTQTLPPGGYVRQHAHPKHDEVVHFISGKGKAVIEDVEYDAVPGMTVFIGKNRRHMFINNSTDELHWLWFITPNGLESFFAEIGRPKTTEAAPSPFPRPENVVQIELETAFSDPTVYGGKAPNFD